MAADALALSITRSSSTMALTINAGQIGPCLSRGSILTTCATSVLNSGHKCKYIFTFLEINSTQGVTSYKSEVNHNPVFGPLPEHMVSEGNSGFFVQGPGLQISFEWLDNCGLEISQKSALWLDSKDPKRICHILVKPDAGTATRI